MSQLIPTTQEKMRARLALRELIAQGGDWLGKTREWIKSNIRRGDTMIWQDPNETVIMDGHKMHELMVTAATASAIEHTERLQVQLTREREDNARIANILFENRKDDAFQWALNIACRTDLKVEPRDNFTSSKFVIGVPSTQEGWKVFHTLEEYHEDEMSLHGYAQEILKEAAGTRDKEYSIDRYYSDPVKFPCLMCNTGHQIRDSAGADCYIVVYFYNFVEHKIEE